MRALHRPTLLARLAEPLVRRPETPTRLVFSLTRRCNLRCSMCRTWALPARPELTAQEVAGVFQGLPRLVWLDVTGGEPFARPDAEDVFHAVASHTPSLGVLHYPTNGWFTRRATDLTASLLAARPDVTLIVTVSLDGPPEVHDRVRGREGSFDRALETLLALRALPGASVYVGTTVTDENAPSLPALGAHLRARVPGFSPREWHWNWLQRSSHYFNNGDLASPGSSPAGGLVTAHLGRRGAPRDLVDLMELAFLTNLEFFRRGEPSGIPCQALWSACFLSPEGDVYPCHVYDRPLGNVRARSLASLWSEGSVLAARRAVEGLSCGGCFTPCEAYPALAGAPLAALRQTARRALTLLRER